MIYFQFLQRRRRPCVLHVCGKHVVVFRCARLFVVYCHKKNTKVYKAKNWRKQQTVKRQECSLRFDPLHSICAVISPVGRVADNIFPIFNLSLVNSFRIYDDSWPHFSTPRPPFLACIPLAPAKSDNTLCPKSEHGVGSFYLIKSRLYFFH